MDPSTYSSLLQEIKQKPFSSDKKSVLQRYLQHYFAAQQCVGVLDDFPHASDKVEALTIMAPRLVTLSGDDAKAIVNAFTFASNQVQALRLIASHIYDPANKYTIVDAFTFQSDKDEARKILDSAVMTGAPPSCHPTSHCSQPCAPYPPPQPQQGHYPSAGGYPQGGYPPPAQGAYPPPQPSQGPYVPPPQVTYAPTHANMGYGHPGYPSQPPPASGGFNIQVGMGGNPPPQQQPAPGESVNVQFDVGGFGFPTGNISFQTQPPRQWP